MAKFRCPSCGAAHKEVGDHCRLCGTSFESGAGVAVAGSGPQAQESDRYRKRGLGHFVGVGLAVGVLVIAGGVALGVTGFEGGDWVRENVPFLASTTDDGWEEYTEPAGVFRVEVPAEPEQTAEGFAVTSSGSVQRYVTDLGRDAELTIGYTEGAQLPEDEPAATLDVVTERFATGLGGVVLDETDVFTYRGYPTVQVVLDAISLNRTPAFATIRLVLRDGELVFIQTLAYEENPASHRRLVDSLALDPEPTAEQAAACLGGRPGAACSR